MKKQQSIITNKLTENNVPGPNPGKKKTIGQRHGFQGRVQNRRQIQSDHLVSAHQHILGDFWHGNWGIDSLPKRPRPDQKRVVRSTTPRAQRSKATKVGQQQTTQKKFDWLPGRDQKFPDLVESYHHGKGYGAFSWIVPQPQRSGLGVRQCNCQIRPTTKQPEFSQWHSKRRPGLLGLDQPHTHEKVRWLIGLHPPMNKFFPSFFFMNFFFFVYSKIAFKQHHGV